jgi:hypothetical protein
MHQLHKGEGTMGGSLRIRCSHLIREVALLKAGSGYLVECRGCCAPLGFVLTPREFQALRRAVIAMSY